MSSKSILVIGLGNPILGDDGVGWVVVQEVENRIGSTLCNVEFDYLSLGGLSLMERLINFQHVILVDSLTTGQHTEGDVITFNLEDMTDLSSGHTTAAHDTSLKTALVAGRKLGASLPEDKDIHIIAIETQKVMDIQEGLTSIISAATPIAVFRVIERLEEIK